MPDIDGLEMKTRVDEILNRHPALGFAPGVVRNGSLEFFHTHGLADLASNRPVAEDTVFRVASITKTFTAIAECSCGSRDSSSSMHPPTTIFTPTC